jgi:hypothetical protein
LALLQLPAGASAWVADRNGTALARFPAGACEGRMPPTNRFILDRAEIGVESLVSVDDLRRISRMRSLPCRRKGWWSPLNLPGRNALFEGCLQEQPGPVSHNGALGPHWRGKLFPCDLRHEHLPGTMTN